MTHHGPDEIGTGINGATAARDCQLAGHEMATEEKGKDGDKTAAVKGLY